MAHFGVAATSLPGGASGFCGGTGYTGEDGVELFVPGEAAVDVWRALVAAGITPADITGNDPLAAGSGGLGFEALCLEGAGC